MAATALRFSARRFGVGRSAARGFCTLDIEAQIIQHREAASSSTEQGTVVGLSGEVARIAGLDGAAVGALVDIEGTRGLVINLETQVAAVALMSPPMGVHLGSAAALVSPQYALRCGSGLLGRAVGVDGSPLPDIDSGGGVQQRSKRSQRKLLRSRGGRAIGWE